MSISIPSGINACNNDTGDRSTVFGIGSTSSGVGTFAAGIGVTASKPGQVALGAYNDPDDDSILSIGAGTGPSDRKTALKVNSDGSVETSDGKVQTISTKFSFPAKVSWDENFANMYCSSIYSPWKNHNDLDVTYWKDEASNMCQAFLFAPEASSSQAFQIPGYWDSDAKIWYQMNGNVTMQGPFLATEVVGFMQPWFTKFNTKCGALSTTSNYASCNHFKAVNTRELKGVYYYSLRKFVIPTAVDSSGKITATVDYDKTLYKVNYVGTETTYNMTVAVVRATIQYVTLSTGTSSSVTWSLDNLDNQIFAIPCIASSGIMPINTDILDMGVETGQQRYTNCYTNSSGKMIAQNIPQSISNSVSNSAGTSVNGNNNQVTNSDYCTVEGSYNEVVSAQVAHIEGHGNYYQDTSGGNCGLVHIEGAGNQVMGSKYAHVEGAHNYCGGKCCHVEGYYNSTTNQDQHVSGIGNEDIDGYEVVGMGKVSTSYTTGKVTVTRKNARVLTKNGCEQARGFLPLNTCSTVADLPSSDQFQGMMYLVGGTKLCIYLGSSWQQFTLATPASEE